jgi:adenine deaminase
VDAIRFATINNAQRLAQAGIAEATLIGALSPGMVADIVLVSEPLRQLKVDLVIHEGKIVAEKGKTVLDAPAPRIPEKALHTVQVPPVSPDTFRVLAPRMSGNGCVRARVLSLPKPPAMPFPTMEEAAIRIQDGFLDISDYLLIAVFNRYGNGKPGPVLGLIKGYSLKNGAAASTLSHDSHNLIVLGTNPEDMALAVNQVIQTGGGMAAYRNGAQLANIAFPVGGLMSPVPVEKIAESAGAFRQAIAKLGLDAKSPIFPFALFSLPVAPGAKVTDKGIWDPEKKELLPLLVEG